MNNASGAYDHFRRWAATLLEHQRAASGRDDEVYQFSTISALLEGVYDGDVTIADILRHGDFGLGTFNRLDGEMVILDGRCFRLRADGTATAAAPSDLSPFAAVTWFHPDIEIAVRSSADRADVVRTIDDHLPTQNLTYAIHVTGRFATLHTRPVPAQRKPYPPLPKAPERQAETVLTATSGA